MPNSLTIGIVDFQPDHGNPGEYVLRFSYDGDPHDVDLTNGEETSIEVPSHAPPPAPKEGE